MPLRWRLQVLEAQVAGRFDRTVRFVEADLLGLEGEQRSAALDALTSAAVLPFAIVGDEVVSTGKLDAETIARGIERHIPGN